MIELALLNIKKSFGAQEVLQGASMEVHTQDRLGLVGDNGAGKTTLFRLMARLDHPDEGNVVWRKDLTLGYLEQLPTFLETTTVEDLLQSARKALRETMKTLQALEEAIEKASGQRLKELMIQYGNLQTTFEEEGGYQLESDINRVCSGLKLTPALRKMHFEQLSGGEKTTVGIAMILLQKPAVLLLDEPSNHLDLESLEWLEQFLSSYTGSVVVISHDRYFLDAVVTKIVEVEEGVCCEYQGNYSSFVKQKEDRLLLEFAHYEDQQKKMKAMKQTIKTLRQWGREGDNSKFHKRAASMEKRLEKMDKLKKPVLHKPQADLNFARGKPSGNDVLHLRDVHFSYGSHSILGGVTLQLRYGEKVALIGPNGSGKSTLLKLVLGQEVPLRGTVTLGSQVRIGFLAQNVSFENEDQSILDAFREEYASTEGEARTLLSRFLFFGEDVFKRVKNLSGGERSRLRLCQLVKRDCNTLILDEPTNHLSIDAIAALEESLLEFSGTVLFVSHDRYFINQIASRVVELEEKKLHSYLGNYDYYREKKKPANTFNPKKKKEETKKERKQGVKKPSTLRIEQSVYLLEEELCQIEKRKREASSDYEELLRLDSLQREKEQELEQLLSLWMEVSD